MLIRLDYYQIAQIGKINIDTYKYKRYNKMNMQRNEKLEITQKINFMINDGIIIEIPIETHINKLTDKKGLFSNQSYKKKEKTTINFLKAISNTNRLKIIQLLNTGARCSCELEFALNLTQPTISHHISILENANIVQIASEGKWKVIQLIESPLIFWILDQLK